MILDPLDVWGLIEAFQYTFHHAKIKMRLSSLSREQIFLLKNKFVQILGMGAFMIDSFVLSKVVHILLTTQICMTDVWAIFWSNMSEG